MLTCGVWRRFWVMVCSEGDTVVYTLTVTNNGPQNSSDATIEDFSFLGWG